MNDIEEIRKRKLEQLQNQYQQEAQSKAQQDVQAQQEVEQLEALIKTRLTKDALQRYGNIKAADPEKAMHVLMMIAQLIQSDKASTIDDQQLKKILMMIGPKKEIKITRK